MLEWIHADPLFFFYLILSFSFVEGKTVSFVIEHAATPEKKMWGLMGRKSLPHNQGMLFHFPSSPPDQFWMFNCYIDLSVAFLDKNRQIVEIADLQAFPDKMDRNRPIYTLKDLTLYPVNDPIRLFFTEKGIKPPKSTRYALEMNRGWFKENGIKSGSVLMWNHQDGTITIAD